MRKTTIVCCLLLLIPAFAHKAVAQESAKAPAAAAAPAQPVHYYHLDFVVEELDAAGKTINTRSYSTTVSTAPHSPMSIRTGSRIPIATGSYQAGLPVSAANMQYQYIEAGVNLDVHDAHEVDRELAFNLTADLSSVAPASDANLHQPVIRQNRWQALVLIPIGKPTPVFKSDSVDSKGATRIVVTATPLP